MPKRSTAINKSKRKTDYDDCDNVIVVSAESHSNNQQHRSSSSSNGQRNNNSVWGVCLMRTTGLMLFVLRFYQPTLSSGMYEVKRFMASKEVEIASKNNSNNNRHYSSSPNNGFSGNNKIVILSNFVLKDRDEVKMDDRFKPHLINKACYADLWGYDFVYNLSWGFPDDIRSPNASNNVNNNDTDRLCFLDFGHWHRVPHLIALTESPKNYEWILWTDLDYVFWDLSKPIESLLKELEINNLLDNIHIVVPDDGMSFWKGAKGQFLFSSFAILIRNSHFGRTVLQNWMEFAKGICPNGNFADTNGCQIYNWRWADQMGLWYALGKTYSDLVEGSNDFVAHCNNQTGYLDHHEIGSQMSEYFVRENVIKTSDYSQIPKTQPILWSSYEKNSRSGLRY